MSCVFSGVSRFKMHYPLHRKESTFSRAIQTLIYNYIYISVFICIYIWLITSYEALYILQNGHMTLLLLCKDSPLMFPHALRSTHMHPNAEEWSNSVGEASDQRGSLKCRSGRTTDLLQERPQVFSAASNSCTIAPVIHSTECTTCSCQTSTHTKYTVITRPR